MKCSTSKGKSSSRSSQRRQLDCVNVKTVVEVLAQSPFADRLTHRTIGCGEDAHVDWQVFACAEAQNSLLFENPEQFGLHLGPHLGDLIEQKAATVRPLEASLAAAIRAGLVAEQFAFDQAFRDSGAIDCHVRSVLARRSVVDRAGGPLFPVPLSPVTMTGALVRAASSIRRMARRIASD
jgi:hypothetical protein